MLACAIELHEHTEACYDADANIICGYTDYVIHTHDDLCYDADGNIVCPLPEVKEHTHDDSCYTPAATTEKTVHTHDENCYSVTPGGLICTLEEREGHQHGESCYATVQSVACGLEESAEHTHTDTCYTETVEVVCTIEESEGHTHSDACYGEDVSTLVCELPLTETIITEKTLICEEKEIQLHIHEAACYDEAGNLSCGKIEVQSHVHGADCWTVDETAEKVLVCDKEEHKHDAVCDLSSDDYEKVMAVINAIELLPTADEIDAQIEEYEELEKYDEEEAYLTEVYQAVYDAYDMYDELSVELKALVINSDKLMELEYIWSARVLIEDVAKIASDDPKPTWYTSTKEFVELNLYDYKYGINTYYDDDKKYPGFQWNGGAYAKSDYKNSNSTADDGIPNYVVDRNYIDSIDFGNSMITNFQYAGSNYAKSTTSTSIGKLYNNSSASSTGKINWLWYDGSDYGTTTNRPVGISTGYESMSKILGDDGYPALLDGSSLKYLFSEEETYVEKLNTESIDGLFQQDSITGEYEYNSRLNHAQYSNNFFTLYEEIITPNFITYPFGNFLPLNSITDKSVATQVGAFNYQGGAKDYIEGIMVDLQEALDRDDDGNGSTADYQDTSRSQLLTMLEEYRENWTIYNSLSTWNNLSASDAIEDYFTGAGVGDGDSPSSNIGFIEQSHLDSMYNIDWDVSTNFFFGMEMKMNFMMPKNGYTGNDTNGDGASDYPMKFYFTGDDDVWVYIDGVLFLDLTGIHRHVGGEIDFVNGKVYYYELDVENGGDVSETPYKTYTFEEILEAAGKSTDVLNSNGTFVDYSSHSFNFYYMERGSGSSVCRLNFNFPLLKKKSITVTKQNVADDVNVELTGNPDYYFNIITTGGELLVGPESVTGVSDFTILDSSGNKVGTGTVDENGVFAIKAGQTAVFEGIEENSGTYYVQELIKAEDHEQYDGTVTINGIDSRYDSLVQWSARDWYKGDSGSDGYTGPGGHQWYGYSSTDTDSSKNSAFYFEALNGVVTKQLGEIAITKKLEANDYDPDAVYKMNVLLDEIPLAVGTEYAVGEATKTVTTEGKIEIGAGETAIISNILSGTKFEVSECAESIGSYTVSYSATNADSIESDGNSIKGIVRAGTQVDVIVTNSQNADSITIGLKKQIVNPDGNEYTFDFDLVEVADQVGTELTGEYTDLTTSLSVQNEKEFSFTINYEEDSGASYPKYYYYQITEMPYKTENTVDTDGTVYIVQVTVDKDSSNGFYANVTRIWKDGSEITNLQDPLEFKNVLLGSLEIGKTVVSPVEITGSQAFEFTISLIGADGNPINGEVKAVKDEVETALVFENGIAVFQLQHGQKIKFIGIPSGATWKIIETESPGYIAYYKVNDNESVQNNTVESDLDSIVLTGNTTNVEFTNQTFAELPDTGGSGISKYIKGGLLLMVAAGGLLIYSHTKRRKEDSASP